jgi:hypothetical protein
MSEKMTSQNKLSEFKSVPYNKPHWIIKHDIPATTTLQCSIFVGFNMHYGNSRLKVSFRISTKRVRGASVITSQRIIIHNGRLLKMSVTEFRLFTMGTKIRLCIIQKISILYIIRFGLYIIRVRLLQKGGEMTRIIHNPSQII